MLMPCQIKVLHAQWPHSRTMRPMSIIAARMPNRLRVNSNAQKDPNQLKNKVASGSVRFCIFAKRPTAVGVVVVGWGFDSIY